MSYGADKLQFEKIDPFKSKITLKVKVNQPRFLIGHWRVPRYTFCAKMEILDWIFDELWRRQAQIWENWPISVQNVLEGQGQSTPFSIGHWRDPRYTFCAKVEFLGKILVKLLRGQAQICENDLEGQGQSTPFSIGFWRVPRYKFCAKMEILGWILDELSCG